MMCDDLQELLRKLARGEIDDLHVAESAANTLDRWEAAFRRIADAPSLELAIGIAIVACRDQS
jgi:hypothetical protein